MISYFQYNYSSLDYESTGRYIVILVYSTVTAPHTSIDQPVTHFSPDHHMLIP